MGSTASAIGIAGEIETLDTLPRTLPSDLIVREIESESEVEDLSILCIVGRVGDLRFENLARKAVKSDTAVVTIEHGGRAGQPSDEVIGAIGWFPPTGACYNCATTRATASTSDPEADGHPTSGSDRRVLGALAGWQISTKWLEQSEDHATMVEFPWAERTVLPVPGCPVCQSDGVDRWNRPPADAGAERSLDATLAAAERALDDRLGIVTAVGEHASLPLPYYQARLSSTAGFSDASAAPMAAGVDLEWDAAFMKALGEALERYAAGVYNTETFHTDRLDSLEDAIDPRSFVRPADSNPGRDSRPWIPGTSLDSGDDRWLPAEIVLFPPPERTIRPAITTGLGLGSTPDQAALSGLTELLERDAAMLSWYSSYEPLGVSVGDSTFERISRLAAVEGLDVSVVSITQDVDCPVIAAAVHREEVWPRFAAGSAADPDPTEAAIDALQEAIQNWIELDTMGPELATDEASRIARYASDPGPAREFFNATQTVEIEQLKPTWSNHKQPLNGLVRATVEVGLTPLAAWITPRDLSDLGFTATRIVIPTAQPLFTGQSYFGERARSVPESMGFSPQLERSPHPFP